MQKVSPRKLGTLQKSQAVGEHDLIPLGFAIWGARWFDSIAKISSGESWRPCLRCVFGIACMRVCACVHLLVHMCA